MQDAEPDSQAMSKKPVESQINEALQKVVELQNVDGT
ncbi:MAG: hypothetical protein ACI9IJ_002178 [Psychromonas sp.]